MDIQTHKRTQQIKKMSRWLYRLLSLVKYALCMLWLMVFWIVFFADRGELSVGGHVLLIEQISPWLKYFIVALFALGLTIYIRIASNFRNLMRHFMQGDIFSLEAISYVRAALNNGVLCFILALAQKCFFWYLASANVASFDMSLWPETLVAMIFFALMYTLLWTLEIGCDLNEESEMTI